MSFTNDDLKRLKELDDYVPPDKKASTIEWRAELWEIRLNLPALLARLEAAERICTLVEKHGDGSLWDECEVWRKACGR